MRVHVVHQLGDDERDAARDSGELAQRAIDSVHHVATHIGSLYVAIVGGAIIIGLGLYMLAQAIRRDGGIQG